ncbi:MAG: iron chelate uptake ABC transporter family permease subunit, partial [Candidatus Dadabacteria bacterium]|nr:iron chelate uptake ABC transporter family permease subunit [Candidatus Dadabacteria bacterium]
MPTGKKMLYVYAALSSLLLLTIIMCVSLGAVSIPFDKVISVIAGKLLWFSTGAEIDKLQELIVWNVRLPRVMLAATIGGGLSIVGAVMQAMFRNSLAEPGMLGWSSGGAFFAVLAIYTGVHQQWFLLLPLAAFAGTLLTAY